MLKSKALGLALIALFTGPMALAEPAHHASAHTYIISPADGATVTSPVKVLFGLHGKGGVERFD